MASTLCKILIVGASTIGIASCTHQTRSTGRYWGSHMLPRQASFSNSTTPTPSTTATSCQNDCTVCASTPSSLFWTPYSFTETFLAATVVEVINTIDGTTRTSTIFNEVPAGYTQPSTNSAGTHITLLSYTRSGKLMTTEM